ncbi:unnamed protein product [Adineta steineri]|uniref:Uncharacterized protein n=1 Tax=Adineta steineri TaxID=433720 RepID=A0A815ZPU7_9BILA|nr:unnamed protein product [Adineta steineri]CAF1586021.1 unnamed protein product [Adineta steineri]
MAQTVSPVIYSPNDQPELVHPNHFIIWLDQHIGQRDEYHKLKRSFTRAMNPNDRLYEGSLVNDNINRSILDNDDIDRSILLDTPLLVQLDDVEFMFQAFNDIEKCFNIIEKNLDKRIFLITSGSKGKFLIPSLVINFPKIFKEGNWMYVFCANMNMVQVGDIKPTNAWAMHYLDRILMFDHEDNLLARMVLDMASYFTTKANDLKNNQRYKDAYQYLTWSRQMHKRYGLLTHRNMTDELKKIDQEIDTFRQELREGRSADDEDGYGEACGD